MIILHAASFDNHLWLWAEAAPAVAAKPVGRRKGRAAATTAAALPFDAGAERLGAALNEWAPGCALDAKDARLLAAWLPSNGDRPVASSQLIAELPPPETALTLAPWGVTAIQLRPSVATALLGACMDKETLGPGVVVGKDLAFWAAAWRFAASLAVRQQFLPGLARTGDQYHARWEALCSGVDNERLAKLAQAMPHAGRALSSGGDSPPQSPALTVLRSFLNGAVDHLVRSGAVPVAAPAPRVARKKKAKAAFDSLHDQWLHALRAEDGLMQGAETELAALAAQVAEWRRPVALTVAAPVKLCFRLEEPPVGDQAEASDSVTVPWQVRFLLQAADDPSLLVEAAEVWAKRSQQAALLGRGGFKLKEYLLSALGQAAGLCPRIEASLKTAAPAAYQLDAAGAFEFLSERAWALQQAGFGVFLPAWWTGKGTKQRLTVRANVKSPAMQGASGLSLEQLIQFNYEIALGDAQLSLAELELLARLKAPLVKLRGQWVQLTAAEIQAALELWKKQAEGQARVRDVLRMALGAQTPLAGVEFGGVSSTGWMADLLAQLEGQSTFEELVPPAGFQGQLRPYQTRGYSWLAFLRRWGLGACLADDMGLGKTIQMLALVQRDWETHDRAPVLLVCPTSVTGNWQKEAARFTPQLPVLVHHGTERTRGAAFAEAAAGQALVVTSYSLLHRDLEMFKQVPWAAVVLDEAQNIKNPETKQARAARALEAGCRIALTGTPVENNVGDLWSIMEFLNPGFLGGQSEFKRRFFLPIQVEGDTAAAAQLKRLTGPFILRRLKTDKRIIADLPDKLEMKVFCPLTKEQASLYQAVVKETGEALEGSEGIQRKGLVLATLVKLKQVCNHPAQFLGDNSALPGRSGKLARLGEMLEEVLAVGDRALVFTQFAEMGALLQRHLQETFGREALFLHGATPRKQRDRMVERFQGDTDAPGIFVLSLKAGGTGLNLTRASHVFHFDRWWNPAVENQATDRAFRIGQTRNVQVHKFVCQGTLEDKIDEMIERKKEIAANVVGAGEGWLTELSNAELKELFALRAEAIQE